MNNEIENLKRQIKIKDRYLQLIIDIGFDYDGFNNVDDLKSLVDGLCTYAEKAKNCDDKNTVYVSGNGIKENILGEKIDANNN